MEKAQSTIFGAVCYCILRNVSRYVVNFWELFGGENSDKPGDAPSLVESMLASGGLSAIGGLPLIDSASEEETAEELKRREAWVKALEKNPAGVALKIRHDDKTVNLTNFDLLTALKILFQTAKGKAIKPTSNLVGAFRRWGMFPYFFAYALKLGLESELAIECLYNEDSSAPTRINRNAAENALPENCRRRPSNIQNIRLAMSMLSQLSGTGRKLRPALIEAGFKPTTATKIAGLAYLEQRHNLPITAQLESGELDYGSIPHNEAHKQGNESVATPELAEWHTKQIAKATARRSGKADKKLMSEKQIISLKDSKNAVVCDVVNAIINNDAASLKFYHDNAKDMSDLFRKFKAEKSGAVKAVAA